MLRVIQSKSEYKPVPRFLTDIPEGTIFRARIASGDGKTYSGVWLNVANHYIGETAPKLAVLLDRQIAPYGQFLIEDGGTGLIRPILLSYEELDAVLTVSPARNQRSCRTAEELHAGEWIEG